MKSFFVLRNKDAADEYVSALISAGYTETRKMHKADFLLIESDHGGSKYDALKSFALSRPVFVYPHTPYAYWLWDRARHIPLPVACNFVVGDAGKKSMQAYGYPYRVEVAGWTGCDILPFEERKGKRLIFAPPHLLGNGRYAGHRMTYPLVEQAAAAIARNINEFEAVHVSHSWQGIKESGLSALIGTKAEFEAVNTYRVENPRQNAIRQFKDYDIVISANTFAYIAIAQGKPTVLHASEPLGNYVLSYDKYRQHYEYPLQLERMTLEDVLNSRKPNPAVEAWKAGNIGTRFDAGKFLAVVAEYVKP